MDVSQQIDWAPIVSELFGASAAMVVKAAQDAAKSVVLSGRKSITENDLRESILELKRTDRAV
jgi:ATP-dependent 26S proteasome regulatory subunit